MENKSIFKKGFLILLCALVMLSTVSAYLPHAIAASNGIFASPTAPIVQIGGSKVKIDLGLVISIPDQQDLDSATVIISNFKQGDMLHFANENGITGHYNSTNGVLSLKGVTTIENYQAILRKVEFSTTSTDVTERNITISIGNALYFEPTQHFYEFVPAPKITWISAKAAAENRYLYGRQGYLATITNEAENNFIKEKTTGQGWLGASDAFEAINVATGKNTYTTQNLSEGNWYWVTGPEKGTKFWNGTGSGSPVSGQYSNWMTGEPNNQGGEHYAHIFGPTPPTWGQYGKWNDFANTTEVNGYIVEYGGLPTDSINDIQVTMTKNINVVDKFETSNAPTASDIHFNADSKTVEVVNVPSDTKVSLYINNQLVDSKTSVNGAALFEGLQVQNGDLVSVTFTESNKLESDRVDIVVELPLNLGFEYALDGWSSSVGVGIGTGGTYPTDLYLWTVNPFLTKMAVLTPWDSTNTFESVSSKLVLSQESKNYIQGQFPNTTNFAYIYQDLTLEAGEELTMAWNYIATDYAPFNDSSFTSLVNVNDSTSIPTVNGVKAQVGILGATVLGTGNYSTGDYGSTGWQVATYKVDKAGTYRLGFAIFNLSDMALSPYLFVDKEPGITLKDGEPFGPIGKDPNAPPPAGEVITDQPKEEDILVNATDNTVTIKKVPANTTVKLYKGDQLLDTQESTSGDITFTDVQVAKGEEIQVTFTEEGKTESEKTSKLAQVRSENVPAEMIIPNATKDTVIVKDVPKNALIAIYNESDEKIGEIVQTNDAGDVEISIPAGLSNNQSIKVTITKTGELESKGTTVIASLEQTVAPAPSTILVNATDKVVQIEGVPADTTIHLYKKGEKTPFYIAENVSGNVEFKDLAILEDEIIQVTYTAPDHLESVKVNKQAQIRSDKIDPSHVLVNATTNVVHVQDVYPGETIVIYDTDGVTELGRTTNNKNETSDISIIIYDKRIQEHESLQVTRTEVDQLESQKTSVVGIDTDDQLKLQYVQAGGHDEDTVYSTVVSTETQLTLLLNQTPLNKEEIQSTVATLQEAIKNLEEATIAKAIQTAVTTKEQAELAKNRFTQAGGKELEAVYQELEEALLAVNNELAKKPKDVANIITTTATLKEKIKILNDASAEKELQNAIAAAKIAKADAGKAQDRYDAARGDVNAEVYVAVAKAIDELNKALDAKPQDTKAIEAATDMLVKATKDLDIASASKELRNAIEDAEKAKSDANKALDRYEAARGDVDAEVFETVKNAIEELDKALTAEPKDTKAIEAATDVLVQATQELEKASAAKELSNAIEAAEKAKADAKKAQDRYENARGDVDAEVFKAVKNAIEELEKALTADPQDTKAIEAATEVLVQATQKLEKASAAKELSNAIEAAEKAKVDAEKAQERYENARGDVDAEVFKAVTKAVDELNKALATDPQDTKAIEAATEVLVQATQKLEKASAAKELSNAIEAAEKAKADANKAQERYEKARGDVDAKVFKAVTKAVDELNKALAADPQDTKAIEAATDVLNNATLKLEKASAAKELSNAIEAAKKAKADAEKAQERYENARGDVDAEVFETVKNAIEELDKALTAEPQDTKAIEAATDVLVQATQELEKASTAKELSNAIEAAEKAKADAEKAQARYGNACGDVDAEVFETVNKAIEELNKALTADPKATKAIEAATDVLVQATQELEKASAAKELSNAIEAAEKAKADANKAQERYEKARGDVDAEVFKAVTKAVDELNKALAADPQDTKAIEAATDVLVQATQELEKASAAKELSNAIEAAEKAKAKAEKAQDRYENAHGNLDAEVFEAVAKALEELNKALAADPQDTKAIEAATEVLNKATKELEKASAAKELSNAIEAAEKAKAETKKAQDRYENARGDENAEVFETVKKASEELDKALAAKPQDTKTIEAATDVLNKATQELEKASAAQELMNAIEVAEKTKADTEKAQDRYENAHGDKDAEVFGTVKKAIVELDKALATEPQDTKAIEAATDVLDIATQELEKASAAKELSNAIEAAEKAKDDAKKAQDRYENARGDVDAEVYKAVTKAVDELNKALAADPQDTKAIEAATDMLNKAIDQLQKKANGLIKESILQEIKSLTTIQDTRDIKQKIDTSELPEADKEELYSKLVDKVLKPNNDITFERASDIALVKDAIDKSNKTEVQMQESYIALAEKAINELSKRDYPTNQREFQTDENQMIDSVIKSVTNANEQSTLSKTHKAVVDVLSLTKDNAFTFTGNDTWESITSQFLLLSKGNYGTPISWNSTNTSIVSIANDKAATHRQAADKTAILTAKLSTGSKTLEKTFLLVIKSQHVGTKVVENTKRETTVTNGSSVENAQSIQRINLIDKNSGKVMNKIDKVVVDSSMIPSQTNGPLSIYLPDDKGNLADELAIEMPFDSVLKLTNDVFIRTDQGTLFLSKETIQRIQADGIDLFFRIVPVRDSEERTQVIDRTKENQQVKATISKANGDAIKVLGTPKEIETNYKGYDTEIILPLEDVLYEGIDLDNLYVFIEHSDGEKVVVKGEIVEENGKPVGIKFSVNKFSTFTIFEVVSTPDEQPKNDDSKSQDSVGTPSANNNNLKDENGKQLPSTATTQYNLMLFGLLVSILGLVLLVFSRKRNRKKIKL